MKYMIKSSYKNTYIKLNKTNIIRRKFIILGGTCNESWKYL